MKYEDEEIWLKAKAQHEAVGKVLDALRPLSQRVRRRVLNWAYDRCEEDRNEDPGSEDCC